MPVWLRMLHIHKVSEWNKKQNEEMEKANKKASNSVPTKGPNINPNSTYNFKK